MTITEQEVPLNTAPISGRILTAAEQADAIKEEILRFTKLAREKGFLTIEEINDLLPADILDVGVLDSFMQALEVAGVIITDPAAKKDAWEDLQMLMTAMGLKAPDRKKG